MLHTKFGGNQPAGSREEDIWLVFTIYGHGGHLGHVTSIVSTNYNFYGSKSLHTQFGKNGSVVSEKETCFNFHTLMALGQGQVMTLTFNTHIPS